MSSLQKGSWFNSTNHFVQLNRYNADNANNFRVFIQFQLLVNSDSERSHPNTQHKKMLKNLSRAISAQRNNKTPAILLTQTRFISKVVKDAKTAVADIPDNATL